MSRWERFKYTIVQPGTEPDRSIAADERSVEELEDVIARSDDKERTIGLVAAPLAACVSRNLSLALSILRIELWSPVPSRRIGLHCFQRIHQT